MFKEDKKVFKDENTVHIYFEVMTLDYLYYNKNQKMRDIINIFNEWEAKISSMGYTDIYLYFDAGTYEDDAYVRINISAYRTTTDREKIEYKELQEQKKKNDEQIAIRHKKEEYNYFKNIAKKYGLTYIPEELEI